jgi:hypothetical protein
MGLGETLLWSDSIDDGDFSRENDFLPIEAVEYEEDGPVGAVALL